MTHLTDISRAMHRPAVDAFADALLADLCSTMAHHSQPRPLDMVGPREAAEADALTALLVAAERLTRKRLGVNAGDVIAALIAGNKAACEAAIGFDRDGAIEDAAALLAGACDDLAEEWAANMKGGEALRRSRRLIRT